MTLLFAASARAGEVRDDKRGFTFTLPGGYRDFPEGRASPNIIQSFIRGDAGGPSFGFLNVEALGGSIARDETDRAIVERAARDSVRGTGLEFTSFDYEKVRWKNFDLDLVVAHASGGGQSLVMLGTQVPLAAEAIQIQVGGPASEQDRLRADLDGVLRSLEGKSNWLTDRERSERLGRGIGTLVLFTVPLVIGIVVLVAQRRRKKRAQVPTDGR